MTDLGSSRPAADSSRTAYDQGAPPTAWAGWVAFAAMMMLLLGCFQAVQGLVAVFDDGFYHVTEGGLVVDVDYTAWGWVHLLLGLLIVAAGAGLLAGNMAARILAVALAGLSAILNLAFIEAKPIWSIIVIALDVLVIYSVTVHGRELRGSSL
jgi:hypothetical protein